jgi:REP element-mobilizing transposase RayT
VIENSPVIYHWVFGTETKASPVGTAEQNEGLKMAHSYMSIHVHYIFSTKNRERVLKPELRARLFPYMGGIAKRNHMKALVINGVEDHVHLLLSLPATLSVAKAIQLIKGGSSKWIHEQFPELEHFSWQEGYGAFSVGVSQVSETIHYIQRQQEHHRQKTFREEYIDFLRKHNIEYDERFLWG